MIAAIHDSVPAYCDSHNYWVWCYTITPANSVSGWSGGECFLLARRRHSRLKNVGWANVTF